MELFQTGPSLLATIVGVVGFAVGPGGVFYFLVKRGLNGSVESLNRMDRSIDKISRTQDRDHDALTRAVNTLDSISEESSRCHQQSERNARDIATARARCDILHSGGSG